MNRPEKETLRRILEKMHKQNDYEKFAELTSASGNLPLKADFRTIEFSPDDPYHPYPLLMKNIHSIASDENYLYILLKNNIIHIVGLKEREHLSLLLEEQVSFWEMFCWTCRSYWDYFRMQIAKIY